jgi:hypothetical protein
VSLPLACEHASSAACTRSARSRSCCEPRPPSARNAGRERWLRNCAKKVGPRIPQYPVRGQAPTVTGPLNKARTVSAPINIRDCAQHADAKGDSTCGNCAPTLTVCTTEEPVADEHAADTGHHTRSLANPIWNPHKRANHLPRARSARPCASNIRDPPGIRKTRACHPECASPSIRNP